MIRYPSTSRFKGDIPELLLIFHLNPPINMC
jgi:hypothetical protein